MYLARLRKYRVLFAKGFSVNLQYLSSHFINTVASAMFGVVYIYLWKSVTPPSGFGVYTPALMVQYVTFNQTAMWFTAFGTRISNKIHAAVRSGAISTELGRPVDYFTLMVVSEYGSMAYSLVFRGLPVGLMLQGFGYHVPRHASTWVWTILALALGAYIGIVNHYIVGISSLFTLEIRTARSLLSTMSMGFGGASMPLEVLPDWLYRIARWSPFASLTYNPSRIFLELSGPELLLPGMAWAIALTVIAKGMTRLGQRKLEVQGG